MHTHKHTHAHMYTHPLAIGIRHTAHILQETSRKLPGSETGEDGNRVGLWRVEQGFGFIV